MTINAIIKTELAYWDQQRANLATPAQDARDLYQIKKLLSLAFHKLQAQLKAQAELNHAYGLIAEQEQIDAYTKLMQLNGIDLPQRSTGRLTFNPHKMAEMAIAALEKGTSINAYADEGSNGNNTGTRGKKATIPMHFSLASDEALLDLYRSLPAQRLGQRDFDETMTDLIWLIKQQLKLNQANKKLAAKAERARLAIKRFQRLIRNKKAALAATPSSQRSKANKLSDQIKSLREKIQDKQELINTARPLLKMRAQKLIIWDGIKPDMEISKAASMAAEILGTGTQDALMAAHGIRNRSLSNSKRLIDQFSLSKRGTMGEAIASSFPGFPEAEDLMQEGFLLLASKQSKQGADISNDAGLTNQAIRFGWSHLKRDAQRQKRDLATALTTAAASIARPEIEPIDPFEALDNQGIWDIAQKCCTEKQLAAIRLIYRDEYSQREAAAILGITQKTLAGNLKAGEKKIRSALLA